MRKNESDPTKRVAGPIPFYDNSGGLLTGQTFAAAGETAIFNLTSGIFTDTTADAAEAATTGMYYVQLQQPETNFDTFLIVRLRKAGFADQFFVVPIDNTPDVNVVTVDAAAVTAIQAGLATTADVAAVQADTDDIQTRLPAALVGGKMDSTETVLEGLLTPTRAGYLDNLSAGPAALEATAQAIKAKTDNLPADPASTTDIAAAQVAIIAAIPSAATIRDAILDDLLENHTTVGSIADGVAIAAGLLQGNFFMDNVTNTSNGQTAARVRIWRSAVAMGTPTPGAAGLEGAFTSFQVTTTYTGPNKISTHTVVRV